MSHFCNRNTQTSITLFFNWQSPVSFLDLLLGSVFPVHLQVLYVSKVSPKKTQVKGTKYLNGFLPSPFPVCWLHFILQEQIFLYCYFLSQLGNDRASPSSYGAISEIGSLNRLIGITCLAVGSWPASHTLDRCIWRHLESECFSLIRPRWLFLVICKVHPLDISSAGQFKITPFSVNMLDQSGETVCI